MERERNMNRRTFLGSAGAAAGFAVSGGMQRVNAAQGPPFVTGVPGKKLVGCYMYSLEDILDGKYMDALQKELGVNVLLYSPPIKCPQWFLEKNPIGPDRTLCARAHTEDDTGVHRAVEAAHERGMDLWLYYTGHHYGEESRPIISETFDGVAFLDLPRVKYTIENMRTSCFTKPVVKELEPQIFAYGAKTYAPDSLYVSHYRYSNPSFWTNMLGCACEYCRADAHDMGYDFAAMKKAVKKLLAGLSSLDAASVRKAARFRMTFTDFLATVGDDDGVLDWLVFRAKAVGNQLKRINSAARTATNGRCGFITDTHNATLALLVGHNWADFFDGGSDGLHPLSWLGGQHVAVVASWANLLREKVRGLDEPAAIRVVSALFGWDEIGLPDDRIHKIIGLSGPDASFDRDAFYEMFNPDLTIRLLTHEWTRMAAINNGRLPTHPVIKGDSWPEPVGRELMDIADDLGLTGYVIQRTDNFIDREKL